MKMLGKALGAVAVAGAIAAGGAAFTDANSGVTDSIVGHSEVTVSGVAVQSIDYTVDGTGENVTDMTVVLDTDTTATGTDVALGFTFGGTGPLTACVRGAYDAVGTETPYTCTPGAPVDVDTAQELHLSALDA